MPTVKETDLRLPDGVLHVYDTGGKDCLPLFWHHGTPNIGVPPEPLSEVAERLGLRWVSWDRPGYGLSTPAPGRNVGSAGRYAEAVADALGRRQPERTAPSMLRRTIARASWRDPALSRPWASAAESSDHRSRCSHSGVRSGSMLPSA